MIHRPIETGSFVKFTYRSPDGTEDAFKEIFVLHHNWGGKIHGLDLKRMTPAEAEVLRTIMDPETKKQLPHRIPLVNDILKRMDPLTEATNPLGFYQRFVKVFIRGKDVYRTYWPQRMLAIQVMEMSQVRGKVTNPTPLFKK